MEPRTIGIDLGTTNTCVSYMDDTNTSQIILNHLNKPTTPSFVTYLKPDQNLADLMKKYNIRDKIQNTIESAPQSFQIHDEINKKVCGKKLKEKVEQHRSKDKAHKPQENILRRVFSKLNPFRVKRNLEILQTTEEDVKSVEVTKNCQDPVNTDAQFRNNNNGEFARKRKTDLVNAEFSVNKQENTVVGHISKLLQPYLPQQTVYAFKRFIGQKSTNLAPEYSKNLSFCTKPNKNGDLMLNINEKLFSPILPSSELLKYMKKCAERKLGKIEKAVVTVPAYFNETQRQATKIAGKLAGLDVIRVLSEPTAAALAFGLNREGKSNIAVYDLGGGTFDFSILELNDGLFEVKAVNGNSFLGGEDVDISIMQDVLHRLESDFLSQENGISQPDINSVTSRDFCDMQNSENSSSAGYTDLQQKLLKFTKDDFKILENPFNIQHLKEKVEEMKIALSNQDAYNLKLYLYTPNKKEYELRYTKQDLERIALPIIEKSLSPCLKALDDANLLKEDLDHIILVGGATKMPLIRKVLKDFFGKEPNTSIDPDLAIAIGASIQAGIIENKTNAVLLDVNSLSLGIETIGGIFSKLIHKNTKIPVKKTQIYTNSEDDQTEIIIKVYQGERSLVKFNKLLGEIKLLDLEKRQKNEHRIEVTFECDVNGILKVTAKDLITNKEQQIQIEKECLFTEDVNKLLKEYNEQKSNDENLKKCAVFKLELDKLSNVTNNKAQTIIQKYMVLENFDVDAAKKEIGDVL